MWNLDSLYTSTYSDSFKMDICRIQSLAKIIEESDSEDEQKKLFREFYAVFNRAMSYCNLKNMDTDENYVEKLSVKTNLSMLRNIFQSVNRVVNKDSLSQSILKPSSDLFTDFYYSSLKDYNSTVNKVSRIEDIQSEQPTYSDPSIKFHSKMLIKNAAHSLIGIKTNVLKLSELEGYSSPLEKSLEMYQIPEKTFQNMINSMEELIPKFREYFKNKSYSEIISKESLIKTADTINNVSEKRLSNTEPSFPLEDSIKIIKNALSKFSNESAVLADNAFRKGWINTNPILTDPLCVNIPSVSEFRIKLDYKEDLKSIISLAHELGHGYHGFTLFNDDILNFKYPLSVGECSALFFEDLIYDELKSLSNGVLKDLIREQYISNIALFTMDVYARYLFEKKVYESIKAGHTDSNKLCDIMKECLIHVYGDIPNLNEYLWIEKSHYYNFSRPYYNIPYIFGIFIEKTLYTMYKNRTCECFPNQYKLFFSRTNTLSIRDNMLTSFDLDIEYSSHWNKFIDTISGYL